VARIEGLTLKQISSQTTLETNPTMEVLMSFVQRCVAVAVAAFWVYGITVAAAAQGVAPNKSHHASAAKHTLAATGAAAHPLPPNSVTKHTISLPGRTLSFTATAGSIVLHNGKDKALADIAYVAYRRDQEKPATRPVTFVFNGGPGASSAWLQLGAMGPWRLPMPGGKTYPSSPPRLVANADTWLDFTDLVFVDPPGTGYSKIVVPDDAAQKELWSVTGDVDALSVFIRRWLVANGRTASPKFIVGESYGGFRAPLLSEKLARDENIGITGLVLISPALDLSTMRDPNAPFTWAIRLPSYDAVRLEQKGPVTRADLAGVEAYASGQYIQDFLRGPGDKAAVARMATHVARVTGLDPALVLRLGGRVATDTFVRAFYRGEGKIGSAYDPTITAYDPNPFAHHEEWLDPVLPGFRAPLASAMVDLYRNRLGWKLSAPYHILNDKIAEQWNWGRTIHRVTALRALRRMLALDPHFRVLVTGGLMDLVVPYFGNALLLREIPEYGATQRLFFKTYPGGHMFYDRGASRAALSADAERLIYR
jgi:carboxypeptidase C (cathepsin A)